MNARIALAATLLVLPLAACNVDEVTQPSVSSSSSSSSSSESSSSSSSSSSSESSSSSSSSSESSSSSAGGGDAAGQLKYGDTVTFKDGVKVTVSKPEPHTPGEYAFGKEKFPKWAKFTVTVKNDSKKPVEASRIYIKGTAGNVASAQLYESGAGRGTGTVLPGKELQWKEIWGYKQGDELLLEVDQLFNFDDDTKGYFLGKP